MSRAFSDSNRVYVDGPGAFESALRRFMKACRETGVFSELKKRESYLPPSVRRRAKSKKAATRRIKAAQRRRSSDLDWKPERA
jgi:small subunit ribosomal protein S21